MGVGKILDENARLRAMLADREELLRAREALLSAREAELAAKEQALADRDEVVAAQQRALDERKAEVEALKAANDDLTRKLELLRLKRDGARAERYVHDPKAPPLPLAVVTPHPPPPPPRLPEHDASEDDAGTGEADAPKKKRGKPRRRKSEDFPNLPTRTIPCRIDPTASCASCGGALEVFGTKQSWRLDWVPGHFVKTVVEQEKCACPACPSEGVLVAPPPSFALPRAMCGNGLLAAVLVDKFADHIPLNRQADRMARLGLEIGTNTLAAWVTAVAPLLLFIVEAIDARLLAQSWLQADDTGMPVQDGGDGKLRKGRFWAVTDQQEVRYHFTTTKEGEHPVGFLAGYQGRLLLVDGGSEFNEVVRTLALVRAGCWSHLRRYFFDARHHHPDEAALALATIRDLFRIEEALKGCDLETIREIRDRDSRPLVVGFFEWVDALRRVVRPTSALGEALTYASNGKESFLRFLDHPELPMHNNLSELLLRQNVVGRKNWLFARSEGGAQAAAIIYSLISSCMLQGIDPWEYLVDVLDRLPDHPSTRVHELTPMNWRIARERERASA